MPRPALHRGCHKSGQTEVSKGKASKPERSPRRIRGRDLRMLGRNGPGSEGNLASDFENQDMTPAANGDVEAPKVETPKIETPKAETAKPEVTKNVVVKEAPPRRAR